MLKYKLGKEHFNHPEKQNSIYSFSSRRWNVSGLKESQKLLVMSWINLLGVFASFEPQVFATGLGFGPKASFNTISMKAIMRPSIGQCPVTKQELQEFQRGKFNIKN